MTAADDAANSCTRTGADEAAAERALARVVGVRAPD
jgi:hypothetical protein